MGHINILYIYSGGLSLTLGYFLSLDLDKSGHIWKFYASSFENVFVAQVSFAQMKSRK